MSEPGIAVRKRPVEVRAIRWTGENVKKVLDFGNSGPSPLWGADFEIIPRIGRGPVVRMLTHDRSTVAEIGDWIIRGVKGEFYPCKPAIFEATYDMDAEFR